jgi:hypothetical protein
MLGCLLGLSLGMRAIGAMEQHWHLAGATQALADRFGTGLDTAALEQFGFEPLVRPTDDADANRAWDAGAAMSVDEAVDYALRIAAELSSAAAASP